MAQESACAYTVVRYVPDPIRNEPRNIGVIVLAPSAGFAAGRFRLSRSGLSRTTERFRMLEAAVRRLDIDLPASVQPDLFAPVPSGWTPNRLELLHEECTGSLRFTPPGGALAEPNELLGRLFHERVPAPQIRHGSFRRSSAVEAIRRALRLGGRPEEWAQVDAPVIVDHETYRFDVGVSNGRLRYALETLSFLNQDLQRVEERGGWFAHVWPEVSEAVGGGAEGILVVETPTSGPWTQERFTRIRRWADEAAIRVERAQDMDAVAAEIAGSLPANADEHP
jgi:DUF3037 family protein